MKRHLAPLLLAGLALRAADAPPGPPVELPPLIVEEAATLPPWLFAAADGTEYLSRCSEAVTRGYIEMRRGRMAWLRALLPDEMLARFAAPATTVLVSQKLRPGANAEVIGEVLQLQGAARADGGFRRATTAPSMMLTDTDTTAVFAYIDEGAFDRRKLTISSDHVRFLLARRTPAPPAWLLEGLMAAYNAGLFDEAPVTLAPLAWHSAEELRALAGDSGAPRTLLPLAELFAGTGGAARHPAIAQAQAALLVRWAIDPKNEARAGFWRFAAQACAAPATEAMLHATLGLGFADLRDRLSDYLPAAVRTPLKLPSETSPAPPALEIRRATPGEIARLRGEWERLAAPLVRARHPESAVRYLEQARRTLRRAIDAGEREPRLAASLGLCELDAGNAAAARPLLERAVAESAPRPRAALELARLRWGDLTRGQPATRQFSADEIAPVLDPLRRALEQPPAIAEAIELWADAWARCAAAPAEADVQRTMAGARQFITVPRVCLRGARALGRHGRAQAAVELLGAGFAHARDEATRAQFAQLFAALRARPPD